MASTGAVLVRVAAPTALVAVVATASAIAVNMATGAEAQWWWWLFVGALTVLGFVASLWQFVRQNSAAAMASAVAASGERSVAVRGDTAGSISTGDINGTGAGSPGGSGTTAQAGVTASGSRSVAVEGATGGDISTGDRS